MLEVARKRLRALIRFVGTTERKIVYTDFQDELVGVRDEEAVVIPTMTGAQYDPGGHPNSPTCGHPKIPHLTESLAP
jgi:hypothetical protein